MAEGEAAQERSQRRGRICAREQFLHPAMAQQSHVIDRIGPGDHPRHQRGDLQPRVGAEVSRQVQVLIGQVAEAGFHCQRHRRDKASGRHEIRIVEGR